MTAILVFDLETQRLASEVGGWSHVDRLGFAAGVTYNVGNDHFNRYREEDIQALLTELQAAQTIIGFNLTRFDYQVLKPYGLQLNRQLRSKTLDMLESIHAALGFRVGLDNLAEATLGMAKTADGLQSVAWYKSGQIEKVLDYCEADVRVTHALWSHGVEHGQVNFRRRRGGLGVVPVDWGFTIQSPPG